MEIKLFDASSLQENINILESAEKHIDENELNQNKNESINSLTYLSDTIRLNYEERICNTNDKVTIYTLFTEAKDEELKQLHNNKESTIQTLIPVTNLNETIKKNYEELIDK